MVKIQRVPVKTGFPYPQSGHDFFISKVEAITNKLIEQVAKKTLQKNESCRLPRVAIKDNIAALGAFTTCGSRSLASYNSPFEASVVHKLRENKQGDFTLVGKTKMDEFGMGSHSKNSCYGPAVRRALGFDLVGLTTTKEFSPGGSSGGSAVAVAEDYCDFALGTDTGGSVRLPAAYTGIVGFKPSYGLISRFGVVPYANSMDTVGFLTRSVADSQKLFTQTMGYDAQDPTSLSKTDRRRLQDVPSSPGMRDLESMGSQWLKRRSIGYPLEYNIKELDPQIRDTWKFALKFLGACGAKVVPVSLPNTKNALSAYYILAPAEAASNLSKYDNVRYGNSSKIVDEADEVLFSKTRGRSFGNEVQRRILLGTYTLSSGARSNYFIQAQKVRRLVQRDFNRVFKFRNQTQEPEQFDISDLHEDIPLSDKFGPEQVDFILCPTAPNFPPELKDIEEQESVEAYKNDVFTVPASLAGLPAISIPVKLSASAPFPAGIQIIGQYCTDSHVLRLARELESLLKQFTSQITSRNLSHN